MKKKKEQLWDLLAELWTWLIKFQVPVLSHTFNLPKHIVNVHSSFSYYNLLRNNLKNWAHTLKKGINENVLDWAATLWGSAWLASFSVYEMCEHFAAVTMIKFLWTPMKSALHEKRFHRETLMLFFLLLKKKKVLKRICRAVRNDVLHLDSTFRWNLKWL